MISYFIKFLTKGFIVLKIFNIKCSSNQRITFLGIWKVESMTSSRRLRDLVETPYLLRAGRKVY
jgi:hypothetical protein